MARLTSIVALCLGLIALVGVSGAPVTKKGPTISNAGGVALSADGATAFVSTTSTSNAAIYAYPLPITASSNLAPTPYYTTTASVQYYYIAASVSTSPQLIWIVDNQNAHLLSLPYVNGTVPANTSLLYDFSPNVDLVDGMYYQPSTNLLFFACYDHFGGATNDFVAYINPYAADPTLITLFTTSLVQQLAGIAVSSSYLYMGFASLNSGASGAQIQRVPIHGGATPTVAAGSTPSTVYNTTNPNPNTAVSGQMIYPSALVLNSDESILYITDIGFPGAQPASTPHVIYGLYALYAPTTPLNISVIYTYIGANTEIQQSFGLSPDQSTLYFAATGSQNGLYQTTAANSSIVPLLIPRSVAPTSAPAVSSSATTATSAPTTAASAPISARAASSSTAVPSTSTISGGGGGGGGGNGIIPAGTITVGSSFNFSDAGDALSCLTSNSNFTAAFAGSAGGDIFSWSYSSSPTTISPAYIAGTGAAGASFIACESNPSGALVYFLDTRGVLLYSWASATPMVAPVVVATFSGEATGALTALAIDFVANVAFVGTRSSDAFYLVDLLTRNTDYGSFGSLPAGSDLTSFFLSADGTTLYYGFPAPAQGVAGGIAALPVSAGTIDDPTAFTVVVSSTSIIYPDSIWINDTTLYFKDGGAYHGQAGTTQGSTQTISSVSLTTATPTITVLFSTTTLNLPPGLIQAPPTSFEILAFTTASNIDFLYAVNGNATVSPAGSSAPAGVFSSVPSSAAATSAPVAATSAPAAATSSPATAASATVSAAISARAASSSAAVSSSGASSAAAVSSSAVASSSATPPSSAIAAPTSTPGATSVGTTDAPRAVGDPVFVGFLRQRFQVHGIDGSVYNILSQGSVSINALFVFLESGKCPVVNGVALTNCWSHPGSYFGSLALQTSDGDQLEIISGSAAEGFGSVRFDGETMKAAQGVRGAGVNLSFQLLSSHEMSLTIDNYRLVVENSDMFVNIASIEVLDWQRLVSVDRPHGLFGQTWKPSRKARGEHVLAAKDVVEGDVDDYVIASDQLFGTDFVYNEFAKAQ